jgi:hypothetical protein
MADVVVGAKLEADASGAINNVRNFRQELKLAQQEVVTLSEKFGATSKQAAEAAKRAAELKDKIGDAAQLVDAFNPDTKFRAFGASIQTVVGGFTALTGAMGLLGVESEEVQKTLLKVQSALALSQGISQLQEGIGAIKNLGSVLVNTLGKSGLIGIAIAGVAALGLALAGVFDGASRKTKELNASLKELAKAEVDASKEVAVLKNAFEQARLGIISKEVALKTYNEGIGKTVGFAKDLNEAEKLTADNAAAYIKVQGLKAQANYLLGKSAEISAEALIQESKMGTAKNKGGILSWIFGTDRAVSEAGTQIENALAASKQDAADLMNLVTGINQQLADASKGFKTPTGSPGATSKAAGKADAEKYVRDYKSQYDAIVFANEQDQAAAAAAQKAITDQAELDADKAHRAEMDANAAESSANQKAIAIDLSDTKKKLSNAEFDAKMKMAQAEADILSGLSELLGNQTAAGKALAVAATVINTYAAIAGSLRAFSGVPIPGYAIAQAIATGIFGLVQVKKILGVQIPGKGGGGSGANIGSASAPLSPALPQSTTTRLDRDQLNQIGNATVRAFVIESDVSGNQERIRRLNRAARIG